MREFDKNQKVAIVTLGCVAIFVFFGAIWQLKTRLAKPFDYEIPVDKVSMACSGSQCSNDLSILMNKMTQSLETASGTPVATGEFEVPDRLKNAALVATSSAIDLSELDAAQVAELEKIVSGQSDPASLRAMMISGGADPEMLKNLSDEDLVKIYQETLAQSAADSGPTATLPSSTTNTSLK